MLLSKPTESEFVIMELNSQYHFKALHLILMQSKYRQPLYRVLERERHMAIAGLLPVMESSSAQKAVLVTIEESTFRGAGHTLLLSSHAIQNQ